MCWMLSFLEDVSKRLWLLLRCSVTFHRVSNALGLWSWGQKGWLLASLSSTFSTAPGTELTLDKGAGKDHGLSAGWSCDSKDLPFWMASRTQGTRVWINSGSWWWTERPGVLQAMVWQSQTWLSDWTELNKELTFPRVRRCWVYWDHDEVLPF